MKAHRTPGYMCAAIFLVCVIAGCGGGASDANPVSAAQPASAASVRSLTPTSPAPIVRRGNWVVMGSSTAAGTGATPGHGWVALLQAEWLSQGATMVNIARNGAVTYEGLGATSSPVLNRPLPDPAINIDRALIQKPRLLIVAFPTNDVASGYSTDETVNNLLAIRATALAASVPVIVVSTQPRALSASKLLQLREIDARIAQEVKACFVAVRADLAGPNDWLAPAYDSGDGIHPNDAGHLLIAGAISKVLRNGDCVQVAP